MYLDKITEDICQDMIHMQYISFNLLIQSLKILYHCNDKVVFFQIHVKVDDKRKHNQIRTKPNENGQIRPHFTLFIPCLYFFYYAHHNCHDPSLF